MSGTVHREDVTIGGPAPLAGTLFRPGRAPRAAVVIHAATGTPAGFYHAFAEWLAAERGMAALAYDYRGTGRSAPAPRATMSDWGIADQQAARDWLAAALPDAPLWVVGHSLGGMMLPYQTGLDRVARTICVASGAVHLSDHPWPYRAVAASFWFGPAALAARLLGRVPGRIAGLRGDVSIPAPAFRQWRTWCTDRRFHGADPALPAPDATALGGPVRLVAVEDDALCPPRAVWRLGDRLYGGTMRERRSLAPQGAAIGHHGVFRRAHARRWPDLVDAAPGAA